MSYQKLGKKSSGYGPMEANSVGGQGSRRAVTPSDDGDVLETQIVTLKHLSYLLHY